VEDQRRKHHRHERLGDEHDWRNEDRGALLQRAHLGDQADHRGGDRCRSPEHRRQPVVARRGIGDEFGRQRAPGKCEAGGDHRQVGDRPAEEMRGERHQCRRAEQRQYQHERDSMDVLRGAIGRERRDSNDSRDDRADRHQLAAAWALVEHALAERQQHEQPDGQRRLHHLERHEQQSDYLQWPPQRGHRRTGEPAAAAQELPEQRDSQRVALTRRAGIDRLDADP